MEEEYIDWKITKGIISALKRCTTENGFNTNVKQVELVRKSMKQFEYPLCVVIPKETMPQIEFTIRNDILPFLIFYSDGKLEENDTTGISFIERYKDVQGDLQVVLKQSLYTEGELSGIAQNLEIEYYNHDIIEDGIYQEEVVILQVNVERTIDPDNPKNVM